MYRVCVCNGTVVDFWSIEHDTIAFFFEDMKSVSKFVDFALSHGYAVAVNEADDDDYDGGGKP